MLPRPRCFSDPSLTLVSQRLGPVKSGVLAPHHSGLCCPTIEINEEHDGGAGGGHRGGGCTVGNNRLTVLLGHHSACPRGAPEVG